MEAVAEVGEGLKSTTKSVVSKICIIAGTAAKYCGATFDGAKGSFGQLT